MAALRIASTPGSKLDSRSAWAGMAERQAATPPLWLGRSRWRLLWDAIAGLRRNLDNLVQLVGLFRAFLWPPVVRRRLRRLRELGHIDDDATLAQLWVAARDQMILSASEETRLFYRSQGIPWVFHNLRRFLSAPATMLDPVGLFSPRDTIVLHVLQTFHRHPLYDFVLLRAHPGGVEAMQTQLAALQAGTHVHQRALTSLIEDGSYHARLAQDLAAFIEQPHTPPRPIPDRLVPDPWLMLGMDQFKDLAGFVRYAARLNVGPAHALWAWLAVAWNATVGQLLGLRLGPRTLVLAACDPELCARHMPRPEPAFGAGR